jgi:hypothetical protein
MTMIVGRCHASAGDEKDIQIEWELPTGYTVTSVEVTADGGTLSTGAHAHTTVDGVTYAWVTRATAGICTVTFTAVTTFDSPVIRDWVVQFV